MKLLVVCPDYISHYLPMSAIAAVARRRGTTTVIATGPALRNRVERDGFRWQRLVMSRGANPGVLSERDRQVADSDDLAAFFTATEAGMVATLSHQAVARADDLLWEPLSVAAHVDDVVARERPDAILVDHLAFAATLALRSSDRPFTTFVPGHPTQVPCGDEVYGFPPARPRAIVASDADLRVLRGLCEDVTRSFTDRYNEVLATLAPAAVPVPDAFAAHGEDVLYNSPADLRDPARDPWLGEHAFLGSCVRVEPADDRTRSWIGNASDADGFAFVSFGTFLSARSDVLGRVVGAFRRNGRPVALSTGTADLDALGQIPASWLVARSLPQVSLLAKAGVVVTHGGNNTVTESLTAGCPMVVLPFSTDQFVIAADLERAGLAVALDPNRATIAEIIEAVRSACSPAARQTSQAFAASLRRAPGPDIAIDRLLRNQR